MASKRLGDQCQVSEVVVVVVVEGGGGRVGAMAGTRKVRTKAGPSKGMGGGVKGPKAG